MAPSERTISEEVEQSILLLLPSGRASIKASAAALGMNLRTLQRHLDTDGTGFAELLRNQQRQLAQRYLGNPKLRMTDIADLLGYASLGSFTRWFAGEFAESPSTVRKRGVQLALRNAHPGRLS